MMLDISIAAIFSAMWIATAGGVVGACLLLPSPLPGYRMPLVFEGCRVGGDVY